MRKLMRDPAQYAVICSDKYMEPLIRHWIEKKKNLIFADEAYLHYGQPVIALNNEKVGEMAAEELFRYGFRTPALLDLAREIPSHSADEETMKRIISVPVESGGAMWRGTLYQVIAVPEKRSMQIKLRDRKEWLKFSF